MNNFMKNVAGMGGMTDQVIATDFLVSAKSGVIHTSMALTEAATPALRAALREQLHAAIDTHEKISSYMMAKGYYHPNELSEQLQVDMKASENAINLAEQ